MASLFSIKRDQKWEGGGGCWGKFPFFLLFPEMNAKNYGGKFNFCLKYINICVVWLLILTCRPFFPFFCLVGGSTRYPVAIITLLSVIQTQLVGVMQCLA